MHKERICRPIHLIFCSVAIRPKTSVATNPREQRPPVVSCTSAHQPSVPFSCWQCQSVPQPAIHGLRRSPQPRPPTQKCIVLFAVMQRRCFVWWHHDRSYQLFRDSQTIMNAVQPTKRSTIGNGPDIRMPAALNT